MNRGAVTFEALSRMLRNRGVERVFIKQLAPNDNSKNQIYLGEDLSVLSVLPSGDLTHGRGASTKPGAEGKQILKAPVPFSWLAADGAIHKAPNTQLILYPQYPEVRLSGFLSGSTIKLGQWFDVGKQGRSPGRILVLGVARDATVYGFLVLPESALAREIVRIPAIATFGGLHELRFNRDDGTIELLSELTRIHRLGWIVSKRLDAVRGVVPCDSPNCGGYTLEAELGIFPNGLAEPDYRGWEVKTFSVKTFERLEAQVITLMTPEPDGGIYKDQGAEVFVRRFGYADVSGRLDRINFGGVHTFGKQHPRTELTLALTGFNAVSGKILDVNGGIALLKGDDCAALWSYKKLIEHWKKKHDKAVYLPNQRQLRPTRRYQYGNQALLGRGADFTSLLRALVAGDVYYDPGIKLECASDPSSKAKRRNQFRIKARNLTRLYGNFERQSL